MGNFDDDRRVQLADQHWARLSGNGCHLVVVHGHDAESVNAGIFSREPPERLIKVPVLLVGDSLAEHHLTVLQGFNFIVLCSSARAKLYHCLTDAVLSQTFDDRLARRACSAVAGRAQVTWRREHAVL